MFVCWLYWFDPQHTTVPSAFNPQAWRIPTVSCVNTVVVGVFVTWLASLVPQQTGVPSVRSAQAKFRPTATWVNVPVGGVEAPLMLLPQQTMVALVVTPQELE